MTSATCAIRQRLQASREDFAAALAIPLERLEQIERGTPLAPQTILRLMQYAKDHGLTLTLDQVYGTKPLP